MRNYRLTVLLLIALLTLTVITNLTAFKGHSQKPDAQDKDIPTPIQAGAMTEKQREHSKLYPPSPRGKKMSDYPKGIEIVIGLPMPEEPTSSRKPSSFEFIEKMACDADAVVLGVIGSKSSQLTETGDFIFTDYEMRVEEVLKNNPGASIQSSDTITVTRPGGAVSLNGQIYRVKDKSFRNLQPGKTYLLFLDFIPTTGAYKSINSEGSFLIDENAVFRLTDEPSPYILENEKNGIAFINQVRAASANYSKKKERQNEPPRLTKAQAHRCSKFFALNFSFRCYLSSSEVR